MSDLISRQAAIELLNSRVGDLTGTGTYFEKLLNELPSVEAVPVVHGRLTKIGEEFVYQCSVCHGKMMYKGAYCPNCGAKMEGAES